MNTEGNEETIKQQIFRLGLSDKFTDKHIYGSSSEKFHIVGICKLTWWKERWGVQDIKNADCNDLFLVISRGVSGIYGDYFSGQERGMLIKAAGISGLKYKSEINPSNLFVDDFSLYVPLKNLEPLKEFFATFASIAQKYKENKEAERVKKELERKKVDQKIKCCIEGR